MLAASVDPATDYDAWLAALNSLPSGTTEISELLSRAELAAGLKRYIDSQSSGVGAWLNNNKAAVYMIAAGLLAFALLKVVKN